MGKRSAFTLVELVVVVMIIGVLVAIAAPKMMNVMGNATDNSVRMSLNVVRDAIENFATEHSGAYPSGDTEAAFKADVQPYLRGVFPTSLVGTKDADVKIDPKDPLEADGLTGWMYNKDTGEFIINCTDANDDGSTTYDKF